MVEKKTNRDAAVPPAPPGCGTGSADGGSPGAAPDPAATQERLQLAVDAAQLGTWDLDLTTGISVRSRRHDQLFGYEALQPHWDEAAAERNLLPEDRLLLRTAFARARLTGHLAADLRVRWPDGGIHWISLVGRTCYDPSGRPVRIAGVVSDISERKRAELALVETGERLQLAQALGGMGVFEHDLVTGSLSWSEEQFRIYGVSAGEFSVTQDAWRDLLLPEDLARVEALFAEAVSARRPRLTTAFRIRRPGGEVRTVHSMLSVSYAADGAPQRVSGVNVDVTDRLRAVEAVGRATSGSGRWRSPRAKASRSMTAIPLSRSMTPCSACSATTGARR
jgi:PAS domain S-box-containing protein